MSCVQGGKKSKQKYVLGFLVCFLLCIFWGGKGKEVGCLYSIRTKIHVSFFMIFTTDDLKGMHSI